MNTMNTQNLIKTIAIGGVPATGKTTLIRNLKIKLGKKSSFKFGKLRGECYENIFILGIYDEKLFSGTDRLSMAVQPDAVDFMKYLKKQNKKYYVIFEGDRLFNSSIIEEIKKYSELKIYMITAFKDITTQRHIDRKDDQSKKFIKGRYTKLNNIYNKYINEIETLSNNNEDELKTNVDKIWLALKNTI